MAMQKKEMLKENEFGVHETMSHGLFNVKSQLSSAHPLEAQEKHYAQLQDESMMSQLRMSQGIYAPFKLHMERDMLRQNGRLPCLRSSQLSLSVLRGTDGDIDVHDVFNNQREFAESTLNAHDQFLSK